MNNERGDSAPALLDWQDKRRGQAAVGARDRMRLVFCGRLEPVKGAADAIRILRLMPERYRLDIVGDGVERGRLERLAADCRLGSRVRFCGWVNPTERDQLLGSAGALLMPSLWDEAFGMAAIEALAQGTPVVAYDVGGMREWYSPEVGVLVRCGDIGSAAAAVRSVTGDADRWERFSRAARRAANSQFPASRFGRELDAILRRANS